MNEDLSNEEVVEKDVPETSEEETAEEVVVDASQDNEDINKLVEERANKLFEEKVQDRLARDRAKRERDFQRELSKHKQLESIIEAGMSVDNLDEAISKVSEFYKDQGMVIPKYQDSYSEMREKKLAKLDAQEIIELGKEEMEIEANKLSKIPLEEMSPYQRVMFDTICEELTNIKATDELKSKGYDTSILDDKKFKDFREQFAVSTPILKIYDMYNQLNGHKVEQPKSPGSAKNSNTNNEIKDYYTPDEVRAFKEEDLDNPKLMKAIEKSMQLWGKSK